jgi:hypothetical protein
MIFAMVGTAATKTMASLKRDVFCSVSAETRRTSTIGTMLYPPES